MLELFVDSDEFFFFHMKAVLSGTHSAASEALVHSKHSLHFLRYSSDDLIILISSPPQIRRQRPVPPVHTIYYVLVRNMLQDYST
jgi:hypothetical protein